MLHCHLHYLPNTPTRIYMNNDKYLEATVTQRNFNTSDMTLVSIRLAE